MPIFNVPQPEAPKPVDLGGILRPVVHSLVAEKIQQAQTERESAAAEEYLNKGTPKTLPSPNMEPTPPTAAPPSGLQQILTPSAVTPSGGTAPTEQPAPSMAAGQGPAGTVAGLLQPPATAPAATPSPTQPSTMQNPAYRSVPSIAGAPGAMVKAASGAGGLSELIGMKAVNEGKNAGEIAQLNQRANTSRIITGQDDQGNPTNIMVDRGGNQTVLGKKGLSPNYASVNTPAQGSVQAIGDALSRREMNYDQAQRTLMRTTNGQTQLVNYMKENYPGFNYWDSSATGKYYGAPNTQDKLRFMDSLLGDIKTGEGGQLNYVKQLQSYVTKTQIPVLNKALLKAQKDYAGDEPTANFLAGLYGVALESARATAGTGAVVPQERVNQELDRVSAAYNQNQLNGVLDVLRKELLMRRAEVVRGTPMEGRSGASSSGNVPTVSGQSKYSIVEVSR